MTFCFVLICSGPQPNFFRFHLVVFLVFNRNAGAIVYLTKKAFLLNPDIHVVFTPCSIKFMMRMASCGPEFHILPRSKENQNVLFDSFIFCCRPNVVFLFEQEKCHRPINSLIKCMEESSCLLLTAMCSFACCYNTEKQEHEDLLVKADNDESLPSKPRTTSSLWSC